MNIATLAPPVALVYSVLWLGKGSSPEDAVPIGSGTVIDVDGVQYLATAFHVFQSANVPLVRMDGQWKQSNAGVVAYDEPLDIAVMKCPARLRPEDSGGLLVQGIARLPIGTFGLALGFPDVLDAEGSRHALGHISEVNGRPVPFPTQAVFYTGQSGFAGGTGKLICSGYTNAGYSGGVLAFPTGVAQQWSLAAIITGFPKLWRPIQLPEGSLLAVDGTPKSQEHMGLIQAVAMNEVEAIVREGRLRSR